MIVIGIGSTSAATVGDVVAAIVAVENKLGQRAEALATLSRGTANDVITAAAQQRGMACQLLSNATLNARTDECATTSPASMAAHGIASVSEAAALVGAGPGSRLILPRQTFTNVTAAIAASQETP
jgi:cobalt-precorrin 5A hydrolase